MHLSWGWSLDVLTDADARPYAGSRWQLLEKPICSSAFKFGTIHSSSWAGGGILELPFKYFMLRCGFPTGIDGGGTVHPGLCPVSALFCPLTFGSCLN